MVMRVVIYSHLPCVVFARLCGYLCTVIYHVLCSHGDVGSHFLSFTMCCVVLVTWVGRLLLAACAWPSFPLAPFSHSLFHP